MSEVVLALGSNLGDRQANLESAVRLLGEQGVAVFRASSVWKTPPMPADQPEYLNAVVIAETQLSPRKLLEAAKAIEWELGRRPGRRWGPRPIDIDILFYDEQEVDEPDLKVPHIGIRERGFVLAPLAELMSEPLPVLGQTASQLLAAVDQTGLRRVGALPLA